MEWFKYALAIISGLAATIPLVLQLVKYVKQSIMEKNWGQLLEIVMDFMMTAEEMFDDGAIKEEWVVAMTLTAAKSINYDVDEATVRELIRSLCAMSKVVNPPAKVAEGE